MRVAEHWERVEKAKARSRERAERGLVRWQEGQEADVRRKSGMMARLEGVAADWVTEGSLDGVIEGVVDDFMIAPAHRTQLADGNVRREARSPRSASG